MNENFYINSSDIANAPKIREVEEYINCIDNKIMQLSTEDKHHIRNIFYSYTTFNFIDKRPIFAEYAISEDIANYLDVSFESIFELF